MVDVPRNRAVIAFAAGIVTGVVVALVWGRGGSTEPGYPYTSLLQAAFVPVFAVAGPLVAIFVALWTGRSWPFALGMIVPFPVALIAELRVDPTSHNLFPFEVVLVWVPAFLLSWGAAAVTLLLAKRARRAR